MEKRLWYVFGGSSGGELRAKLVRALAEQPRNANQLSDAFDVDYNTIRYHLDILVDNDIVERGEESYGTLYFLTDDFEAHRDRFDAILSKMDYSVE
ncbi:winged helix-turn-helix domain-containing protein [Haloferax sp. DFSO52]|uniref:winged helix-turn-helix domain-containing protein n=1 Tax=Haloferax sp. DFSO52 TaxID=3388505 RepID=UPI003A8A12BB